VAVFGRRGPIKVVGQSVAELFQLSIKIQNLNN
jgi:hypothetical protein